MPTIRLNRIKCNVPDEIDKDEMFLKFEGEKIWPIDSKYFKIDADDKVDVNHEMEVSAGWIEIQLWDFDFVSKNDHLGSFKLKVDDTSGKYSASMKLNTKETKSASYYMEWEVL